MECNTDKTVEMIVGNGSVKHNIKNHKGNLENKILERISETRRQYNAIKISVLSKKQILAEAAVINTVVKPILLHTCKLGTKNVRQNY